MAIIEWGLMGRDGGKSRTHEVGLGEEDRRPSERNLIPNVGKRRKTDNIDVAALTEYDKNQSSRGDRILIYRRHL
jgi:hypothetical protein